MNLNEELRNMNRMLNILSQSRITEKGGLIADNSIIDEKEFLDKLPAVAELAIGDACTGSNPCIPHTGGNGKLFEVLLL